MLVQKCLKKKWFFLLKGRKKKQLAKKRMIAFGGSNSSFFSIKDSLKKGCATIFFKKDLGLLIVNNNSPFSLWKACC